MESRAGGVQGRWQALQLQKVEMMEFCLSEAY